MLVESLAGVVGWGILVLCHIASHLQDGLPRRLGMAVSKWQEQEQKLQSLWRLLLEAVQYRFMTF